MEKKKWNHEDVQHFQDKWVPCLPYAKSIINYKSNVHKVHYVICSKVEGKEKLFIPKLNNMLKHVGHHKSKIISPRVEIGVFYFNGKCQHE